MDVDPSKIIDGNRTAEKIYGELKKQIAKLEGRPPKVVFIRVGEDPASQFYVAKKQRISESIGMKSELDVLPEKTSEGELLGRVRFYNEDPETDGILVQSPLPPHIRESNIFNAIDPQKDVDGFNVVNVGLLAQEDPNCFVACTPQGIIELIRREHIATQGKRAVILGRSLIVGKPMALLLSRKHPQGNASVTICHSRSKDIAEITRSADILIAAIGKAGFVTADMVKPGATVIDVGINRVEDATKKKGYRIVGDVDFEQVAPIAGKITPVPGGVGPMTVATLMQNTLKAYHLRTGSN